MYELLEYVTDNGFKPFSDWLNGLRDRRTKARILARLAKVELGNLGDWKSVEGAPGLFELREHFGPGFRVYYAPIGRQVLLLLGGSDKSTQEKAIRKATEYLEDHRRRSGA